MPRKGQGPNGEALPEGERQRRHRERKRSAVELMRQALAAIAIDCRDPICRELAAETLKKAAQ